MKHKNLWRGDGWGDFLQNFAPHVYGVLKNGAEDWKKLAKWFRAECRVAKVKLPPRVKLPARPKVKKKTALLLLTKLTNAA